MVKAKSPTPQELYRARKQQEEQEKLAYLPPGLINHGNTCFMNSVLQGLIATRLLSNLVHFEPIPERIQRNSVTTISSQRSPQLTNGHDLGGIYEQKWDAGMPIGDVFVGIMYRAWEVQRHRRRESMSPRPLLTALGQKYDQYLDFAQQDAHEFLRILLDAMRMEEFDVIKKRQPPPPKSKRKSLRRRTTLTNIVRSNQETDEKGESEITQLMSLSDMLFGGKLTSILVCQKCKHISQTYEDFNDLSLSLKAEDYAKEKKRDRFKKLARKMGMGGSKHKGDGSRKVSDSTASASGAVSDGLGRLSDASEHQLGVNFAESLIPIRPSSVPPSPSPSGLDEHDPLHEITRRRSWDEIKVSMDHGDQESEDEDGVVVESQDVRDKLLPPSPGSAQFSPDDRKIEFAKIPKIERSEKEKDKSKSKNSDGWARLGRRISLSVAMGIKEKSGKTRSRSRTRKSGEISRDSTSPNSSSAPQIRLSRPSISPERHSSAHHSAVEDNKEREGDADLTITRKSTSSRPPSLSPTASSTAIANTLPVFHRSKSPKPPKPSRAETEYLRAIMADVTAAPVTINHPFGFFHNDGTADTSSVASSSSSVLASNPGPLVGSSPLTSNVLANNLWMRWGQLPLPGVEECLKMFTSVEVLEGDNMVGCRRCWKIANGWYDEEARAERREERRRRREKIKEESDEEEEEEDDDSDEDGRDGDESGIDEDEGDDEDFSSKASEESTTTEEGSERRLRQTSSAPASPSILPHTVHTSMLYAHQNISDGFSLAAQINGDSVPSSAKPILTVQPTCVTNGVPTTAEDSVPPSPTLLTARPGAAGFAAIKGEYNPNNIVSQSKDSLLSSNTSSTSVSEKHRRRRHDGSATPSSTDYSSDDDSDTTSISTAASASVRSVGSSAWTSVSPGTESQSNASPSSSSHYDPRIQAPHIQMSHSEPTHDTSQSSSRSSKPKKSKPPKPTIMRPAYKRYLISSPPPVLVIHLKRFQQVSSKIPVMSFSSGFKKMDDYVAFPEFLDLTPFMAPKREDFGLGEKGREVKKDKKKTKETKERFVYRLYAVVVHIGNMLGGHYIAYTALPNPEDVGMDKSAPSGIDPNIPLVQTGRQWAYISDTVVRLTTLEEVLKAKAYICMYERI